MSNSSADKPPTAGAPPPLPEEARLRPADDGGRAQTLMYTTGTQLEEGDIEPPSQGGVAAPDLFIEPTPPKPKRRESRKEHLPGRADDSEKPTVMSSIEDLQTKEISDDEGGAYIGKLIDDRYFVKSLIGRGGMGAVYHVEQVHLRKEMAIKLLHENLIARKQLISRFTREARAISRLSSPHTVMVYDFGRWGELFYLVMELMHGEPLDGVLTREGPISAERATRFLVQMCDSLQEAHDHGIVHRDLKPENIMVLADGPHPDFIKILDFGLAKVEDVDDPYTIHSQKDIFGTPFYMSPEQIRAADVDGRSDIYAVGALTFKMLTGKQVFGEQRTTFDVLKAHLMNPAPAMRDVVDATVVIPQALEDIVAKCLAKHPEQRFQDMAELNAALIEARKGNFTGTVISDEERREIDRQRADGAGADVILPKRMVSQETRALLEDDGALGRHVRRGRAAKGLQFAAAVIVLLGGIALATWALSSGGIGQESEPNDMPDQANLLDAKGVATGAIGERRSNTAGDRDCFSVGKYKAGDDLEIRVTGVPTMDLVLSVYDADGVELAKSSHRGYGDGELLSHLSSERKPAVVCIAEQVEPGKVAGESLSDIYKLSVVASPRDGVVESEPNDAGRFDQLPQNRALLASIDGPGDRDTFMINDQLAGRIARLHVQSADGQDLAGLHVVMLDTNGRALSARLVKDGQDSAKLAFAASQRQLPDRVVVQLGETARAMWKQLKRDRYAYKIWYQLADVGDEGEKEPNNTPPNATDMVLGAWHTGNADDTAGVDWLRIDAGDPSLRRIHVQASAPEGSKYWMTVRDASSQADLLKLKVTTKRDEDLYIEGSGGGFLVRIQRITSALGGRGQTPSAYRLRARWSHSGRPPAIP